MSNLWGRPAVIDALLNITNMLVPVVEAICSRISPVGCHKRAKAALDQLHQAEKKFEYVDKLMVSYSLFLFFNYLFMYVRVYGVCESQISDLKANYTDEIEV